MKHGFLKRFLIFTVIFSLIIVTNIFVVYGADVSVSNEGQLRQAVLSAGRTPTTITLTADIELFSNFEIHSSANITFKSTGGSMFSLIATRDMPTISNYGTLTIENIRITHTNGTTGYGVVNSGIFIMNSGKISENTPAVDNSGIFTMNGGTISGNSSDGIVNDSRGGTFTMNGGIISGHSHSGVSNNGTFKMDGGTISNNAYGVYNQGSFTMESGTISGNDANGVYNFGTFGMKGGTINGNGCGVTNEYGGFRISGGWIFNNGTDVDEWGSFENNIFDSNKGAIGSPPPVNQQSSSSNSNSATTAIKVTLNGKEISFDQPPIIEDGRTLVPLRAIFEALGATVDWNSSTQTITSVKESTTVTLKIGSSNMTVNGKNVTLDVSAKIVNGRTLVPARAVAEAFGANVDWDSKTRTVIIRAC